MFCISEQAERKVGEGGGDGDGSGFCGRKGRQRLYFKKRPLVFLCVNAFIVSRQSKKEEAVVVGDGGAAAAAARFSFPLHSTILAKACRCLLTALTL